MRLWNEVRWISAEDSSGHAWARAPSIVAITRLRISPCDPAGAGWVTFTMVPRGATTFTGRKDPWLSACVGSNTAFRVMKTDAAVTARLEFTGAGACSAAPVKSAVRESPCTISASGSSSGSSRCAGAGPNVSR